MELQAVVGQLYVINGSVQGGTAVPGLLCQFAPNRAARGRERDALLVHLALNGAIADNILLFHELLQTLSNTFYQATGSVTSALRHAINAVNDQMIHANMNASGSNRPNHEGAITCAVIRGEELYVVQTGEGLAFLGHNFGVERLPARQPERITPLGRSAGLDMRYTHHRLQNGSMLLLADPRLAHFPTPDFAPALVDTEVELGLEQLTQLIGGDSARVLLVEMAEDFPTHLPEAIQPISRPGSRPAPRIPVPKRELPAMGETASELEENARRATAQAAMGISRFTGKLADALGQKTPATAETPAEPPPDWRLAGLLAILIPLIVAVIVTGVYLQWGNGQAFAEMQLQMQTTLGLANEATSEAEKRTLYQEVLTLAQEAEGMRPGDKEVLRLQSEATAALDRLDGMSRLIAHPLYTYNAAVQLTAVTLQGGFTGGIYTLDNQGRVYKHATDESYLQISGTAESTAPEQIMFSGKSIFNDVVGTVNDIFWRPKGSSATREGLGMLDANGGFVSYYPNLGDLRYVRLGLSSEWRRPVAMATFNERLYVLDAGLGQIWKYFPDGDGFVQKEGETTLRLNDQADLTQAVDIAIYSEDGSLAVAYGDGRLRYYDTRSSLLRWDEQSLLTNGLNTPLVRPTAVKLVGPGLNASIFVADPGSGRIIQIGRGGTVLAQYRATGPDGQELFSQIQDFAVAETPLRVFVTVGNTLYVATQE